MTDKIASDIILFILKSSKQNVTIVVSGSIANNGISLGIPEA